MKLYFVRHGETDWNKERKIQGQVDIPLNEFGRYLARETAKGLKDVPFAVCFSSPLGRARETAEIILSGRAVPIVEDARIMEMAFGEWEGKCCSEESWNLPTGFHDFFDAPQRFIPSEGGEDFTDMKKRTNDFLSWLYRQEEYQDKNVLIATHGCALAGLLMNIKGNPLTEYWGEGVHRNCAVTEVEVTDGIPKILSENKVYYKEKVERW